MLSGHTRKSWLIRLTLSLFLVLLHQYLIAGAPGKFLENSLTDLWFSVRGPLSPPEQIVIVGVDRESYRRLGLSTLDAWPRSMTARFLKRLKELEPSVVAMDFVMQTPSSVPEEDDAVARGLKDLPTILAFDVQPRKILGMDGRPQTSFEVIEPAPKFQSAVTRIGVISIPVTDGVVRHFFVNNNPLYKGRMGLGQSAASLVEPSLPLPDSRSFINFYGPKNHFAYIPYWQVIEESTETLKPLFQDKLVFVGLYSAVEFAEKAKDSFVTPYAGGTTAGVEIHATVAANVLNGNWLKRIPPGHESTILKIFVYVASMSVLSFRPVAGFLVLILFSTGWLSISYALFLRGIFLPGLTAICAVFPLVLLFNSIYYYVFVSRKFKRIKDVFSRYLSTEMVQEIALSDTPVKPGGSRVTGTAMFTDIAGFTSMIENQDPAFAVTQLNKYFTELAAIVHRYDGSLLRFLGDGMFIIWGAPIKQPDHASRALNAAMEISEKIQQLREENKSFAFKTRIGIHSGEMLAGNIGTEKRFDYTAVGDTINTTARLESLNKLFGTTIILSEETLRAAGTGNEYIPLGSVSVYGRKRPIKIYTPIPAECPAGARNNWLLALDLLKENKGIESISSFKEARINDSFFTPMSDYYLTLLADGQGKITDGIIKLDAK